MCCGRMSACLLVGFLLLGCAVADDQPPSANTRLGGLRGRWETSRGGRRFAAFEGVPYAQPPVGKLRLQAPEPVRGWNGTRDAVETPPYCTQVNFYMKKIIKENVLGQEDCLYLSVYTHNNISGRNPVLVQFHGGAFTMGNSRFYKPNFFMDEDIVVVSVNYRLGILGFLTFESEELRGNQGLKDQVMALRWIKENIASFGGDPNLVTINGQSAGGASAYHHLVSPLSKGLYHRAIAESGTSYSPWALAVPGSARAQATALMKLVGCPTEPKLAVPCVMEMDAKVLTAAFFSFITWQMDPLNIFGPSLEPAGPEAFLTGPISAWTHNPVPLIVSVNSAEGLARTLTFLTKSGTDLSWLTDELDSKAPMSMMYKDSAPKPEEITKSMRQFYLPRKNITIEDWVNLTTVYGDSWILTSVVEGADRHKGDVYFMYFDFRSIYLNPLPFSADKKLFFGSNHVQECVYLWNMTGSIVNLSITVENYLQLSQKLIKTMVNFIKNGSPGGEEDWKKWTAEDHSYMMVDEKGYHPGHGIAEDRVKFWRSLDYRSNYDRTVEENTRRI